MGARTGIAWTEATWNPLVGCSKVSAGCAKCYAERDAYHLSPDRLPLEKRRFRPIPHYAGTVDEAGRWTGRVNRAPANTLDAPLRWRKPRRIFVNAMSDLFHETVSGDWIDEILARVLLAPRHTFQVLTKRPERMRNYFAGVQAGHRVRYAAERAVGDAPCAIETRWPPPNLWLGVSVENQEASDRRVGLLRDTRAEIRWLSVEPMLEWIDFRHLGGIDWIVVGGESGPRARPFDIHWARWITRSAALAGIPVFVKQLGSNPVDDGRPVKLAHPKGGDPAEWPEELRVREWPDVARDRVAAREGSEPSSPPLAEDE